MKEKKKAILGAGCFWCVEAVFQRLEGVSDVESGYIGGQTLNPTYRDICTGTTGHAEVIRFSYDEDIISFEDLLEIFWTTHDPTTLNRQGADRGTQYRSAVFYTDESQRLTAEASKMNVATKIWNDPIVTEITKASEFYVAENYHQNYFNAHNSAPYCSVVINPKVAKLRQKFANKLKKEYV
ncbi:MAG: peptide-methionine (S)-S-oxide reductase MsrA [Saprospiraceae bacterium]|nr:peptide-methionine (S)-S-oxide reductase MsrA [Saprospiraceae bacterium]